MGFYAYVTGFFLRDCQMVLYFFSFKEFRIKESGISSQHGIYCCNNQIYSIIYIYCFLRYAFLLYFVRKTGGLPR